MWTPAGNHFDLVVCLYVAGSLVSRVRNSLTFSGRGIPAGCVAPPSHMADDGRYARSSRLAIRAPRSGKFVTEFRTRDSSEASPQTDE